MWVLHTGPREPMKSGKALGVWEKMPIRMWVCLTITTLLLRCTIYATLTNGEHRWHNRRWGIHRPPVLHSRWPSHAHRSYTLRHMWKWQPFGFCQPSTHVAFMSFFCHTLIHSRSPSLSYSHTHTQTQSLMSPWEKCDSLFYFFPLPQALLSIQQHNGVTMGTRIYAPEKSEALSISGVLSLCQKKNKTKQIHTPKKHASKGYPLLKNTKISFKCFKRT